jgi:hypothetical protein
VSSTGSATGGLGQAVRRFSTLVILSAIVCAGVAAMLSFRSAVSYSGDGTYLVPPGSGASSSESLSPYDAERIARTYSVVLSQDEQLLGVLSKNLGRSRRDLATRVTAVALPNSSAVRVTYRGGSRYEVRRYFDVLTSVTAADTSPTPNLRPGTLRLLRTSDDIAQSGGGSWVATVAGGLAGLLLGLGAAGWLDRALPRVRSASDLREVDGPSALDVDPQDGHAVAALSIRLLEGLPEGAWLAVVSCDAASQGVTDELTSQLSTAVGQLVADGSLSDAAASHQWLPTCLGSGGERVAQESDRTLLVVAQGADLRQVAMCLSDLRDLGVTDVVLAVVRSTAKPHRHPQPLEMTEAVGTLGPAGST